MDCIICHFPLQNLDPTGNQPSGGTEFTTHGHYGSAVSDFMDGTGLAINICDPCLIKAGEDGNAMKIIPPGRQPRLRPNYVPWKHE